MSETHGQSQEQVVRKEGTGGREAVCVEKGPVASGYGIYGLNSLFLPGEVSPSWCGIVPSPQLTRPVILEKCCVKIPTPLLPDCPFPPTHVGTVGGCQGQQVGPGRRHSAPGDHTRPVPASVWTWGLLSLMGTQKLSRAALRSHHHQQTPARLPAGSGCWELC